MIEYFEFSALFKAIESRVVEEKTIRRTFLDECDLIVASTEEKALSLDKFVYLAINFNLFKKDLVEKFIKNVAKNVSIFTIITENMLYYRTLLKTIKIWKRAGLNEKNFYWKGGFL